MEFRCGMPSQDGRTFLTNRLASHRQVGRASALASNAVEPPIDPGNRGEQRPGVVVVRMGKYLPNRPRFDDSPVMKHQHTVGEMLGDADSSAEAPKGRRYLAGLRRSAFRRRGTPACAIRCFRAAGHPRESSDPRRRCAAQSGRVRRSRSLSTSTTGFHRPSLRAHRTSDAAG
jgi:hypothetical protein